MRHVRNLNDLLVGLLLIAIAALALSLIAGLSVGSATSMGPGYVPRLLCFIQIAFGVGIILHGLLIEGTPFETWKLRPLVAVLGSVAFFAFTIERYGLVVAIFGLVILSTFGYRQTKWIEAIALGLFMAAFSVVAFVEALELPMLVWPAALVR